MNEDVADRPQFSPSEATDIAEREFAILGQASELPSERDQNFRIRCENGQQYVLKIANAAADRDLLECQNAMMDHVADELGETACPRAVPTRDGSKIKQFKTSTATYLIRLVRFLPGRPLGDTPTQSVDFFRQLGAFVGRVSKVLATFAHPAAHRSFHWDLAQAFDVVRQYDHLLSADNRAIVSRFMLDYDAYVAPVTADLRTSVLHGDFNDYNIIVSGTADAPEFAVIDFGDLVASATIHELAIVLAYAMLDKEYPLQVAAELVAGYHALFPLTDSELDVVFPLACMRLCVSVTLAAHQQSLAPQNEYLGITESPAWELLKRLLLVTPNEVRRHFAAALGDRGEQAVPSSKEDLLERRGRLLGPSLSLSYGERSAHIVRGRQQYLYDEQGRPYLDCVNNVCHVGHCHPDVVAAAHQQMRTLNTNTRYLHTNILDFAQELVATLPEPLQVCFFVNSGSEANDLALRMSQAYTGRRDVLVVDGAYHGNLSSLVDISPYKCLGSGGRGLPPHVQMLPMPDGYRGKYSYDESELGEKYAAELELLLAEQPEFGEQLSAFICESVLSCGGQIVLPAGYLPAMYDKVRRVGGVCIADEVQVGLGRVGKEFWGFQTQGVVPDIVTIGKPLGNGHPLAAVVTRPEIADAFANGMEYFNTFGGNPVSCTVGKTVLQVIKREGLQEHAAAVGQHLDARLQELATRHEVIGDVRGLGLFRGVEFVTSRATKEPAAQLAKEVVLEAREHGVFLSTDGPLNNVIKIKPPLPFTQANADMLVDTVERALLRLA